VRELVIARGNKFDHHGGPTFPKKKNFMVAMAKAYGDEAASGTMCDIQVEDDPLRRDEHTLQAARMRSRCRSGG